MKTLRNLVLLVVTAAVSASAALGQASRQPLPSVPNGGSNPVSPEHFVDWAGWMGLKEIRLGELAQQRAERTDVREFGGHMVRDHSGANQKLMALAQRQGFSLPPTNSFYGTNVDRVLVREQVATASPSESQNESNRNSERIQRDRWPDENWETKQKDLQEVRRLQRFSGIEFDRAYVIHLVKDHRAAISKFETASTTLQDPELKRFAEETLPRLREHYRRALDLAKDYGWTTDPTSDTSSEPVPSRQNR